MLTDSDDDIKLIYEKLIGGIPDLNQRVLGKKFPMLSRGLVKQTTPLAFQQMIEICNCSLLH